MAVQKLVLFPDKSLNNPCELVHEFGPDLQQVVTDLKDTLYATPGVGLAAPQIGISKRISVIDVERKKGGAFYVIINPVLLEGEGIQIPREGCLSVPDLLANIRRFESVSVRAQDEKGKERIIKAKGFEALALQHEMDHLDGKLFLDRVTNIKTDVFRRKKY